ncbi:hypothetical protein [Methanolapillus ohkumae]|uniref:hypothetical protein n=1 Tax=Methanolapillus ohkumae TaxID=3028298 RepID=UPI0030B86B91
MKRISGRINVEKLDRGIKIFTSVKDFISLHPIFRDDFVNNVITNNTNEYYLRFPSILKNALCEQKVSFDHNFFYEYQPVLAYRAIPIKK